MFNSFLILVFLILTINLQKQKLASLYIQIARQAVQSLEFYDFCSFISFISAFLQI
jgi:hypothetical protein